MTKVLNPAECDPEDKKYLYPYHGTGIFIYKTNFIQGVNMKRYLFTSESVTEGHPDKVADLISDAILDAYLSIDKDARVAIETLLKGNNVTIAGEVTAAGEVDIDAVVRQSIKEVGYTDNKMGFSAEGCKITKYITKQSLDIAVGVDLKDNGGLTATKEIGAGDQGMIFGYACNETKEYMPLSIRLAHKLTKQLSYVRKNNQIIYLKPDGKSQVTIEYVDSVAKRIEAIVVSAQHSDNVSLEVIREDILNKVILQAVPSYLIDDNTRLFINPTGRFVNGGPEADTGLTGRKIIVDTYGGVSRHGGGCFSGKDPTKVDRSAAYMARYIAKNVVAAGLAERCELQIAFAIGVAEPVSIYLDTNQDEKTNELIKKAVLDVFDIRPAAIISQLDLKKPIYKQLSSYGHMGRDELNVCWEKTDKIDELRNAISLYK